MSACADRQRTGPAPAWPLLLAAAALVACGTPAIQSSEATLPTERSRELYARTNLEKARALYAEGRIDDAESSTRRGLALEPDNPALLRLRAELLEHLGRDDEASELRARVDVLEPPLPPPPDVPHPLSNSRTHALFVLIPPSPSLLASNTRARLSATWPHGVEAQALHERLSVRAPHARIETVGDAPHPTSSSVPAARAWLAAEAPNSVVSLRVDRAFCGNTVKDGDFAVAWLRVAVALPNEPGSEAHLIRVALDTPPDHGCEATAIAYALERVLELRSVHEALGAGPRLPGDAFASRSIRVAFPMLDWRLQEEIAQGRRYLSLGELALAMQHFRDAERIDPEDPVTGSFLTEIERTLALARLLEPLDAPAARAGEATSLGAQLSESQRLGLEAQLVHEQQRRAEMLSALAVLYEMRNAPTPGTIAAMRPVELNDPTATGIALALALGEPGASLEVRSLYAPDGAVIARYYFAGDDSSPVLREEDTNADGEPDRWIGYEHGVVAEVWEAQIPGGAPSLHMVYGRGGRPIERVELDHDGDGRLDRLFIYAGGTLREESWDTDGDGSFDRFQQFDESGSLTMREEDVDGDDEIDVRTAYNKGRIVRREILNAELLSEIQ